MTLKILHFITDRIYHISIGLIVGAAICAWSWDLSQARAAHSRPASVAFITESLRTTPADGVKSLGDLIREQSRVEIPDQALAGLRVSVDPFGGDLLFPNVPQVQPPGFSWGALAGQDREIRIAKAPFSAAEALNFSLVKTAGNRPCNFILTVEFYPR